MFKKYFAKANATHKHLSHLNFDSISGLLDQHSDVRGINAYKNNVIVYRSVNLIAHAASHVPWTVSKRNKGSYQIVDNHPIYTLLNRPNIRYAGVDFFAELISSLLLFGNAYILADLDNKYFPRALYLLNARNVEPIIKDGKLRAYRYKIGEKEKDYPVNHVNDMCQILHIRTYNPNDPLRGVSCLEAASIPIETHHMASQWNNSLLKNGARPSGALVMKDSAGYLSDEQFERLKEQLYEKYTGSANSGKPLLLEGGLDWREISISPKDMDFIESKNSSAREIALAFGVPPQLLGINGDNTYSNMQEARLGLWEETLIPLLDKLSDSLTHWLAHWFNEDIVISFDRNSISALTSKRENLWDKIEGSSFMTVNEKRAFMGLGPISGGDIINARHG